MHTCLKLTLSLSLDYWFPYSLPHSHIQIVIYLPSPSYSFINSLSHSRSASCPFPSDGRLGSGLLLLPSQVFRANINSVRHPLSLCLLKGQTGKYVSGGHTIAKHKLKGKININSRPHHTTTATKSQGDSICACKILDYIALESDSIIRQVPLGIDRKYVTFSPLSLNRLSHILTGCAPLYVVSIWFSIIDIHGDLSFGNTSRRLLKSDVTGKWRKLYVCWIGRFIGSRVSEKLCLAPPSPYSPRWPLHHACAKEKARKKCIHSSHSPSETSSDEHRGDKCEAWRGEECGTTLLGVREGRRGETTWEWRERKERRTPGG